MAVSGEIPKRCCFCMALKDGCQESMSYAGMNLFLRNLDITFRRDPTNFRPRINKMDSLKDREQKLAGSYYYLDD